MKNFIYFFGICFTFLLVNGLEQTDLQLKNTTEESFKNESDAKQKAQQEHYDFLRKKIDDIAAECTAEPTPRPTLSASEGEAYCPDLCRLKKLKFIHDGKFNATSFLEFFKPTSFDHASVSAWEKYVYKCEKEANGHTSECKVEHAFAQCLVKFDHESLWPKKVDAAAVEPKDNVLN